MKRYALPLIAFLLLCATPQLGAQTKQEKAVALQSWNFLNSYAAQQDGLGKVLEVSSPETRQQATFFLDAGLANRDAVSIRSAISPDAYLRHQGGRVKLQPLENTDLFRRDASFNIVAGLTDASWKSFESVNFPGHFLRHKNGELWVERNDRTPQFAADATFRIVAPPAPPAVQTSQSIAQKGFALTSARFQDIFQGDAGTCWILSSIAAVQNRGIDLTRRIRYEGNNRYQVTLFNYNKPASRPNGGMHTQVVHVSFNGKTTGADPAFKRGDPRAAWAVILQRAVIQAVHTWDKTQSITKPHGGWGGDALAILTGRPAQYVEFKNGHAPQAIRAVKAALAARKIVVFGTVDSAKTLVGNHDYAVLACSNQGLTLFNPWGSRINVSWNVVSQEGWCFFIE
jgi:hypothetical protein